VSQGETSVSCGVALHRVGHLAYDVRHRRQKGDKIVKRIVGVCIAAVSLVVVNAWSALAATTYPPSESFEGTSGTNPPPTSAFTGSDVSRFVLVAAVLLAIGLVMLALARRRARTFG
jgi:hypothetical protein